MKKKIFVTAVAALMMSVTAFAGDISVNGNVIEAQTVIVEGRTLVPVRGVFEELGYEVNWDEETKTATLSGKKTVVISADSATFTVDGEEMTPEVPQQIIDGRFMLPLRAVGEAIGAKVDWDAETKTASINVSKGLKIGGVQKL